MATAIGRAKLLGLFGGALGLGGRLGLGLGSGLFGHRLLGRRLLGGELSGLRLGLCDGLCLCDGVCLSDWLSDGLWQLLGCLAGLRLLGVRDL
jgi:hypothetical protein